MLIIKGTGTKSGELPVSRAEALAYFGDLGAFIQKIEDVETVRPLGHAHTVLVTHKPIGALNVFTRVVCALRGEFCETGIQLVPLDFDAEKIKSEHQVLKGFIDGGLVLRELAADRTHAELSFTLRVEFPLPGALKLVPRALVQSTADGVMQMRMASAVNDLYSKVIADFGLVT